MADDQINGYFVNSPWGWRERLRYRLFPTRHCESPEVPNPDAYREVLFVNVNVHLDWRDRLRVLWSGWLAVRSRVLTEQHVGRCVTSSVAYPMLRREDQ